MGEYREIITKAVVARGRKHSKSNYKVTPEQKPLKILGCWIVNHNFTAKKIDKVVEVTGSFDINIWYSYRDRNNTKTGVMTECINYKDTIKLKNRDKECLDTKKVIARAIQQPNCIEAKLIEKGCKIDVLVEREMYVEVIGETKICVRVSPHKCSEHKGDHHLEIHDDEFENLSTDFLLQSEEE